MNTDYWKWMADEWGKPGRFVYHPYGFCQGAFACAFEVGWRVNDVPFCTEHAMHAIAESPPGATLVMLP